MVMSGYIDYEAFNKYQPRRHADSISWLLAPWSIKNRVKKGLSTETPNQ